MTNIAIAILENKQFDSALKCFQSNKPLEECVGYNSQTRLQRTIRQNKLSFMSVNQNRYWYATNFGKTATKGRFLVWSLKSILYINKKAKFEMGFPYFVMEFSTRFPYSDMELST